MLSGAVSAALLWLAAAFPAVQPATADAGVPVAGQAVENIYYVQVDGMT
jgi:hypothetical protein